MELRLDMPTPNFYSYCMKKRIERDNSMEGKNTVAMMPAIVLHCMAGCLVIWIENAEAQYPDIKSNCEAWAGAIVYSIETVYPATHVYQQILLPGSDVLDQQEEVRALEKLYTNFYMFKSTFLSDSFSFMRGIAQRVVEEEKYFVEYKKEVETAAHAKQDSITPNAHDDAAGPDVGVGNNAKDDAQSIPADWGVVEPVNDRVDSVRDNTSQTTSTGPTPAVYAIIPGSRPGNNAGVAD